MAATKEGPIAIAAVGDQVLLAVDDAANAGVKFLPLDAAGYDRGPSTRIDGRRAFGFDYLAGDPGRGRFVAKVDAAAPPVSPRSISCTGWSHAISAPGGGPASALSPWASTAAGS